MNITAETVKQLATEVGFDLCGITSPDTIPEVRTQYYNWLARKFHGEMSYLENEPERRTEPRRLMDGIGSIIMLGLNYYQPDSETAPPGHGRVSRYARGRDYHKIIVGKTKKLIRRMRELTPAGESNEYKWYVDFGPVLERAYAEKAGLGFIGKNSMLISRAFGSWLFLSEVVTTLRLEPDDPRAINHGRCGSCTLCIDACPTGAIVEDRVVDATRCISYLTIERPTEIAEDLARGMGNRIFGCDVCQDVCPHNHRAVVTGEKELLPSHGVGEFLEARRVLEMRTREEFLDLAAGTSLVRTRLEGLQRNARIVLRNEAMGIADTTAPDDENSK
ncbi:MAG: tRNA epoxyqueuosine(34) reductase QueG [candidate division Zixibacteria bacterium]|nr:tRNA epoxyqueuosine(34) reductase QueG [candidate division Zixibacteria bacterium]